MGGSIYEQCRALQSKRPDQSVAESAQQVTVRRKELSQKDSPQISSFVTEFETITLSPVLPDELSNDSTRYELWVWSQYGQHMSITPVGPGLTSEKQPHPLLQRIEDYRKLLEQHMRNMDADTRNEAKHQEYQDETISELGPRAHNELKGEKS
jgi:hypothetical protein